MLQVVFHQITNRMKKLGVFLIIIIQGCMPNSEPELFLIPDKYEGVVVIVFRQEKGQEESYIDKRRVYDIPDNCILLTKFPKTTHGKLNQKFFYKDSLGNPKLEVKDYLYAEANKELNEKENYIMNGVYGQYTNYIDRKNKYPIEYISLTIGKLKDKDSLQKLSERFMKEFSLPK